MHILHTGSRRTFCLDLKGVEESDGLWGKNAALESTGSAPKIAEPPVRQLEEKQPI